MQKYISWLSWEMIRPPGRLLTFAWTDVNMTARAQCAARTMHYASRLLPLDQDSRSEGLSLPPFLFHPCHAKLLTLKTSRILPESIGALASSVETDSRSRDRRAYR